MKKQILHKSILAKLFSKKKFALKNCWFRKNTVGFWLLIYLHYFWKFFALLELPLETKTFQNISRSAIEGRLVWAEILWGLAQRDTHFRTRIILEAVLIGSLTLSVWIPGCLRNGFGVNPAWWVQKEIVYSIYHQFLLTPEHCNPPNF